MPTPVGEASLQQSQTLAIVPKVSSFLSFCGSFYIIYDVLSKMRSGSSVSQSGGNTAYNRIMLGMSLCDVLASGAWFFTTWPIPYDIFPVYGASGTQATCTAQGFFAQFSISTVFYSGSLALYYLLVMQNKEWSKGLTKSTSGISIIEICMHVLALAMGIGTSSTGVVLGLFNPIGWDCWLSAVPLGCKESWLNHGNTTCVRGDNANLYQWAFFYCPLWIVGLFTSIAMYMLTRTYRNTIRASSRWILSTSGRSNRDLLVTSQAWLYAGSFYFVWLFPTILRIHEITSDVVYYHWVMLSATFVPIQGFLNALIYIRPRYIMKRQEALRSEKHTQRSERYTQSPSPNADKSVKENIGNVHDEAPAGGSAALAIESTTTGNSTKRVLFQDEETKVDDDEEITGTRACF